MKKKRSLVPIILSLVLIATLLLPSNLVHASNDNWITGENEVTNYSIEKVEKEESVDIVLNLEPKENFKIQTVTLPDGTEKENSDNKISYTANDNGKLSFILNYTENEETEVKKAAIDIEVTEIEKQEKSITAKEDQEKEKTIAAKESKATAQNLDLANGKIKISKTGYKQWLIGSAEPADETLFVGDYHITGSYSHIGDDIIEVIDGTEDEPISIVLDNVTIDNYDEANIFSAGSAIKIGDFNYGVDRDEHRPGHVNLTLVGDNVLNGSRLNAGIELLGQEDNKSTLVINGDGKLTAQGGIQAAGIGSSSQAIRNPFYKLTINSGTIIATGGKNAAGIGGGQNDTGGEIIINGGNVTAQGGEYGAGIGGGFYHMHNGYFESISPMFIQINGGKVSATGGKLGAGIGTGYAQMNAANHDTNKGYMSIEINGNADVTATAEYWAAGIGQGGISYFDFPDGTEKPVSPWIIKEINITGGTVKATGKDFGAGIGSQVNDEVEAINISGGDITSIGGVNGAGIGAGYSSYVGDINITGGIVHATTTIDLANDDGYAAGIGGGPFSSVKSITIGGTADVTAIAGLWAAGIGRGFYTADAPSSIFPIEVKDSAKIKAYAVGSPTDAFAFTQAIDYECLTTSSQPILLGQFKDAIDENNDKAFTVKAVEGNKTYDLTMPMLYQSFAVTTADSGKHSVYVDDQLYAGSVEKNEDSLIAKLPVDNEKLNAYWYLQPVTAYTVDFESNGGSKVESYQDVISGDKIKAPAEPTKNGYSFAGWYKDEDLKNEWDFDKDAVEGNTTLYAKWTAEKYTITYDLDGGTNVPENKETFTIEDEFPFMEPHKEGYIFLGWYDGKNDGNIVQGIVKGTANDMTVYAHWEKIEAEAEIYTVTFDFMGGSFRGDVNPEFTASIFSDGSRLITVYPYDTFVTKEGYVFEGWYTSKDYTKKWNFAEDQVNSSMTLYAKWTKVETPVTPEKPNDNSGNKPNHSGDSVQTGDTTNLPLFFGGVLASLIGITLVVIKKRNLKNR